MESAVNDPTRRLATSYLAFLGDGSRAAIDLAKRLWQLVAVWFLLFALAHSSLFAWQSDLAVYFLSVHCAVGVAMVVATLFFGKASWLRVIPIVLFPICVYLAWLYISGLFEVAPTEEVILVPVVIGLITMVAVIPFWFAKRFLGWRIIDAKRITQPEFEKPTFQLRDAMVWTVYVAVLLSLTRAISDDQIPPVILYLSSITGIVAPAIGFLMLAWLAERFPFYAQFGFVTLISAMASVVGVLVSLGVGTSLWDVCSIIFKLSLLGGSMWLLVLRFLTSRGYVISSSPSAPDRLRLIRGRYSRSLRFRIAAGKKVNAFLHRVFVRRVGQLQSELEVVESLSSKSSTPSC